jgi:predicted site-specific integrase-resolvase
MVEGVLTSAEVQKLCNVSKTTLDRWRGRWQHTGEVRIYQFVPGGWWRYNEQDVREWMEKWTKYRMPRPPDRNRSSFST